MIHQVHTPPVAGASRTRLGTALVDGAARLIARRALMCLDDALLAECGLSRADLTPTTFRKLWRDTARR
ncbi:MAG: hypothetical protein AAFU80_16545 [Pseudomonadota bacterium]